MLIIIIIIIIIHFLNHIEENWGGEYNSVTRFWGVYYLLFNFMEKIIFLSK
jgi:hypothetical protein